MRTSRSLASATPEGAGGMADSQSARYLPWRDEADFTGGMRTASVAWPGWTRHDAHGLRTGGAQSGVIQNLVDECLMRGERPHPTPAPRAMSGFRMIPLSSWEDSSRNAARNPGCGTRRGGHAERANRLRGRAPSVPGGGSALEGGIGRALRAEPARHSSVIGVVRMLGPRTY